MKNVTPNEDVRVEIVNNSVEDANHTK